MSSTVSDFPYIMCMYNVYGTCEDICPQLSQTSHTLRVVCAMCMEHVRTYVLTCLRLPIHYV